jgi:hypothetical protein
VVLDVCVRVLLHSNAGKEHHTPDHGSSRCLSYLSSVNSPNTELPTHSLTHLAVAQVFTEQGGGRDGGAVVALQQYGATKQPAA